MCANESIEELIHLLASRVPFEGDYQDVIDKLVSAANDEQECIAAAQLGIDIAGLIEG